MEALLTWIADHHILLSSSNTAVSRINCSNLVACTGDGFEEHEFHIQPDISFTRHWRYFCLSFEVKKVLSRGAS